MSIIVGGGGQIGYYVTKGLLAQGHEVLCVDNLFTGTKRNIEHLGSAPRFEFNDLIIVDNVANVDGTATNLTVFGVALTPYGRIQHHRNLFAAVRTFEEVFHILNVY